MLREQEASPEFLLPFEQPETIELETVQPKMDNLYPLIEGYADSPFLLNRLRKQFGSDEIPANTPTAEYLVEGWLAALQTRQEKWE
ncbi:MAG: hypothetical protein HKM89_04865 [Gemmatimonadales bacterium]|nr:hypothetical protein [Gemmatimonadales bacterium]